MDRLGKYELVRHLASGGMASVYLARLSGLGGFERHVVLKTISTDGLQDESLIPMFLDEARLCATLHHQHIAQVYEVGRDDDTYFLAMEYIHGETIRGVLETAGKHGHVLALDFGLSVVCAAAAGLHHAHERKTTEGVPLGIVHRDVTPSNVIVSYDGSIKLIDFGIAKANDRATKTRSGFIKGKAGYMAPEQVKGYLVDRRSDVFALGVLAYELTTQSRAFQADTQFEQLEKIAHGNVTPPSEIVPGYPVELEDVVMRALEVDPDDRYPDARTVRDELERVGRDLGLSLGEDCVMRVLHELYGPRPEPWLVTPGQIDYDITPSIAEIPLAIELVHPRPTMHGFTSTFARGSDEHPVLPVPMLESAEVELVEPEPELVRPPILLPTVPRLRNATTVSTKPLLARWRSIAGVTAAILITGAVTLGILSEVGRQTTATDVASLLPIEPVPPPVAPAPVAPPARSKPRPVAKPVAVAAPVPRDRITLDVVTDPPGASVVVDGVKLGTSPFHAEIAAKPLAVLKVRRSDRVPVKIKVALDRDYTWTVRLPPRR
ncbi:MAG: serine/threonine-protein kinase [Kofleriaceae bacterium]